MSDSAYFLQFWPLLHDKFFHSACFQLGEPLNLGRGLSHRQQKLEDLILVTIESEFKYTWTYSYLLNNLHWKKTLFCNFWFWSSKDSGNPQKVVLLFSWRIHQVPKLVQWWYAIFQLEFWRSVLLLLPRKRIKSKSIYKNVLFYLLDPGLSFCFQFKNGLLQAFQCAIADVCRLL